MNETRSLTDAGQPRQWRLRDLVDFEFLFAQEERALQTGASGTAPVDQRIYAEFQAQGGSGPSRPPDRPGLFRFWLERRRAESFAHEPSPGEQVESILRWLSAALFLAGVILARGAVYSFFRAPESLVQRAEPINVFWYSMVCIALPCALTIGAFWWLLGVRAVPRLPHAPAFIRGALLNLLHPLLTRVARKVSDLSGPEKRLGAQAWWGALKRRALDRSSAIGLSLSMTAQCVGLGFTLGVLLFSWLDALFYSRVFGWQSTQFSITAEMTHRVVKTTAAPWAWVAGEGLGFPSLEQVAQTRFVRYQDPAGFPPSAAAAWANYLIAAALVYAFLPRVILYLLSRRERRQALRNPDFTQARFDRLWERLIKSDVQMLLPQEGAAPALPALQRSSSAEAESAVQCIVILPEELNASERRLAIEEWLGAEKMWNIKATLSLGSEPSRTPEILAELRRVLTDGGVTRVVLVQESFMPPVKGVLKLILQIKAVLAQGGVAIGLLGKPANQPLGEPPSQTDFAVWEAKVLSLADSGLDVFAFRQPVP